MITYIPVTTSVMSIATLSNANLSSSSLTLFLIAFAIGIAYIIYLEIHFK